MPGNSNKSDQALCDEIYRLIRTNTERAVSKLLVNLRDSSEDAVDQYMRVGKADTEISSGNEPELTEEDLEKIVEIRLSHSAAFAHALLQGAADAFEDQKAGLTLLKQLIDVELTELDQDASFVDRATSRGSAAIN